MRSEKNRREQLQNLSTTTMLDPLEVNPVTGEPFLRLPSPHHHIIITPPRLSDIEPSVEIMNSPEVYRWMGRTSLYTPEDAERWITRAKAASDLALNQLSAPYVEGCPVRHIREVKSDGSELYIGDIGIERSRFAEIGNEGGRLGKDNCEKALGDPTIVWQVGYYLSPRCHSQGIMTAAVKAVIQEWAIPRIGAKRFRGTAFMGNRGSKRVMEKNGLKVVDIVKKDVGGEIRDLQILEMVL
ncbi:GNAT domain-containing protein, partial [Mycena floridula]